MMNSERLIKKDNLLKRNHGLFTNEFDTLKNVHDKYKLTSCTPYENLE